MTTLRTSILIAAGALAFIGCGASPGTRSISGQLTAGAWSLDNAVVIARSAAGKAFLAPVSAAGGFHMLLPTGDSYKLTLANSTASGAYTAIARISWPLATASAWARVDAGAPILLSNIAPVTVARAGLSPLSDGSGGDSGSGGGGSGGGGSGGGGSDDGSGGSSDGAGGDDEIRQCHAAGGESDLPYDVRPALGSTFQLDSAFLQKGPAPAAILGVTGATWRAAELLADAPFVITQADCDHAGNRDLGRDRVFITWKNADGTTRTDHLDIRYCDGGGSDVGGSSSMDDDHGCEDDEVGECDDGSEPDSRCDGGKLDNVSRDDAAQSEHEHDDDGGGAACTAGGGGTGGTGGTGTAGSPCTVNGDCATGLACIASVCTAPIL